MTSNSSRWRPWLLAAALALVTAIAYQPAWHGGFLWDDDAYLTHNPLLVAPDGFKRIWFSLEAPSQYFPLVYSSFRLELGLWGDNPAGYHLVNLLLHIANALLVWKLLSRLKVPGAWLAGFIFALHPVQVESVAWITERKNVLMGFFFLLTLLAWCLFLERRDRRRWIWYGLALLTFLAALSAKTTACMLPAAQLLILWWRKERIDWRRILQVTPFVLLGLAMGLVTVWWERFHQGTRGALFALNPIERLLIAGRAFWFYLGKLFWPAKLTFIYPRWQIDATSLTAYLWLLACVALGLLVYRWRDRTGRGVEVALAFFAATLAPLLGFIMLYTFRYSFVADHYQYLACIGPIALVSAGLVRLGETRPARRNLVGAAAIFLLGALALLTWRQSATYRDAETLWTTTIARNPGCWMAYNNLGVLALDQNDLEAAAARYRKALELEPEYSQSHYNLGILAAEKGDLDAAVRWYEKSIELEPNYANSHYNLANVLLQQGKVEEAIAHCRTALSLQPNDPDGHIGLGNALLAQGELDEALREYDKAVELAPANAEALYAVGHARQQKGDLEEALVQYEKALAINPKLPEAEANLGNILLQKGREREAIAHYEKTLRLTPASGMAQSNLAWALSAATDRSLRNGPAAVKLAEEANKSLGGANALVLHTLAAAYAESGRFEDAIRVAEQSLELARAQGEEGLGAELRREIDLYKQGLSYRQP